MGGIDQRVDALGREIVGKTLRRRRSRRIRTGTGCAAGLAVRPASDSVTARSCAAGEALGQLPRLRGAAEDEDASHVAA